MNNEESCPICSGKGTIPNPKGKRLLPWWISFLGGLPFIAWFFSKDDTLICQNCDGKGKVSSPDLKSE